MEVTGQESSWFFQMPWPSGHANLTGVMATAKARVPTSTSATTVLVAVSITDTPGGKIVCLALFATYAWVPSGVMATPKGSHPTRTLATTVLVSVAITDTVPRPPVPD